MKSPSYESKYIHPPKKKTPFWHHQILEVESFFQKKDIILLFGGTSSFFYFSYIIYIYTHICICIYIHIFACFLCFHWCFFRKTKNTHTSPWEFSSRNGGGMPFQVGWKQGGPCGQRSKLQTGGELHEKFVPHGLPKGGESRNECQTNHLCKHTSPMKSYGYMYSVCIYIYIRILGGVATQIFCLCSTLTWGKWFPIWRAFHGCKTRTSKKCATWAAEPLEKSCVLASQNPTKMLVWKVNILDDLEVTTVNGQWMAWIFWTGFLDKFGI